MVEAGIILATMLATTFIWIIVNVISGITEGTLWHLNSFNPVSKSDNYKLHAYWVAGRTFVGVLSILPTIIFAGLYAKYLIIAFYPLSLWLMQPYFHLGSMYETRMQLNEFNIDYEKGWSSDPSSTSEAKINITYKARLSFLIMSIAIWVVCVLLSLI